jgi:hypothetical protein
MKTLLISLALAGAVAAAPVSAAGTYISSKLGSHSLSTAQQAEIDARVKLADTIVANVAADAKAQGLPDTWRITLLSKLYATRSVDLQNMANRMASVKEAHQAVQAAQAPSPALITTAGATADLVFTPIAPCRFIDTRFDLADGPLPVGVNRDYDLTFPGTMYGAQPGNNPCSFSTLANSFGAIALNATVVVSSAGPAGYLTVRPFTSTANTSFLNWPSDGTPGLANAGIVQTSLDNAGNQGIEFVAGSAANPDLIVDIFGYFSPPPTIPSPKLGCAATTPIPVSVAAGNAIAIGSLTCPSGTIAVAVNCVTTYSTMVLNSVAVTGSNGECDYVNNGGVVAKGSASAMCCSVN